MFAHAKQIVRACHNAGLMARKRKDAAARSRIIPRILQVLRKRGVAVDTLVRRLNLPPDAESLEDVAVAPEDFESLIGLAAAELDDPVLALGLPDQLEWSSYHIGELAARASPTLREAFERVVRYASLFYADLRYTCEEHDGEVWITNRLRNRRGHGARHGNEFAVASTLSYSRRMVARPIQPLRVWFAHERPPRLVVDAVRAFFGGCEVAFDREDNGLAFTSDDSTQPTLGNDARLLVTAVALADRALAETPPAGDFVATVAVKLREALPTILGAADVATKMRLATRTLQRRLDDEGTNFTLLQEQVRRDVARELVGDPALGLSEVAYRVGFADAASFSRAFKRWTGQSPGAFRRGHP